MTANVTVQIEMNENVLRVPNAALRFRPAGQEAGRRGQGAEGSRRRGGRFAGSPDSHERQRKYAEDIRRGRRRSDFGACIVLRDGQFIPCACAPA